MPIFILLVLLLPFLNPTPCDAGETLKPTSVFEKPVDSSHQIEILPKGTLFLVTGEAVWSDNAEWVPVHIEHKLGWVRTENIRLTEGDTGYYPEVGSGHTVSYWASMGPAVMNSNQFYYAYRLAIGLDAFLTKAHRSFAGFSMSTPFSSEQLSSNYDGKVQRYNTYLDLGYFLLPHRLFLRGGLGLSLFADANRNLWNKLSPSGAIELGWQVPIGDTAAFGIIYSYEYTAQSRISVNAFQDAYHCLLGGCDTSAATPAASIFALSAFFSFSP